MRSTVRLPVMALVFAVTTSRAADLDEHPMDYVWELDEREQADHALELLWAGTDPERRWVAWKSNVLLMEIDGDPDDPWVRAALQKMHAWMATERDEFVLTGVLRARVGLEDDQVGPLFLGLLRERSPNLRHRAVQHYVHSGENPAAIPILEELWRTETRDWIRDDIMTALAHFGSTRFVDDFTALALGDDPVRAGLALEALATMNEPAATRAIISMTTDPGFGRRTDAVSSMVWIDSEERLDALLALTHDPEDDVRAGAATALTRFADPQVEARFLELAESDRSPEVRYRVLYDLDKDDPRVRRVLEREAMSPPTPENEELRRFAERQLAPPPEPDPRFRELQERQARGEEIDWEYEGYEVVTMTCSCGGSVLRRGDPGVFAVIADDGHRSTRCWDGPEAGGDFGTRDRVPGGTLAVISDHHDHHGEPWVWVWMQAGGGCWMPRSRLGLSEQAAVPAPETARVHIEFDLYANDWRRGALDRLEGIASIEIFDRFESVTGVALEVVLGEERVQALLDAYRGTDQVADRVIHDVLEKIPESFGAGTELRARLEAALLPPEPEETSADEE